MNQYNVGNLVRITKKDALKHFKNKQTVFILPCKVNPLCSWWKPYAEIKSEDGRYTDRDFQSFVNAYEYYNCNAETGRYASYYMNVN